MKQCNNAAASLKFKQHRNNCNLQHFVMHLDNWYVRNISGNSRNCRQNWYNILQKRKVGLPTARRGQRLSLKGQCTRGEGIFRPYEEPAAKKQTQQTATQCTLEIQLYEITTHVVAQLVFHFGMYNIILVTTNIVDIFSHGDILYFILIIALLYCQLSRAIIILLFKRKQ